MQIRDVVTSETKLYLQFKKSYVGQFDVKTTEIW